MYLGDGCVHSGVDVMCGAGGFFQTNKYPAYTLTTVRVYQTKRLTRKLTNLPTFNLKYIINKLITYIYNYYFEV